MQYKRGEMGTFPLGSNGAEKYEILYLGEIYKYFPFSGDNKLLYDDYLFIFSSWLDTSKESNYYGHVSIDLVRHDRLSYFNYHLRKKANYHVLEKDPLILNDFLEIHPEETEHYFQVSAHLKNQNLINSKEKVSISRDFRILFVKENKINSLDNLPRLELGPEFQAIVDYDRALERLEHLYNCSSTLSYLTTKNKEKSKEVNTTESITALLKKEIKKAENIRDQAYNDYIDYRRSLQYIHKRTNS